MSSTRTFEHLIEPMLDAGFNLARWLVRDESLAEDILQEAALRAFRSLAALRGDAPKPWFLQIVRHVCLNHLRQQSHRNEWAYADADELDALLSEQNAHAPDPAQVFADKRERSRVDAAIRALPAPWREMIVLRELEGLDYIEIAQIAGLPIGTVMSRLARARARLRVLLEVPEVDE